MSSFDDIYNGPDSIAAPWHQVWMYTYTRSYGENLRAIIIEIHERGLQSHFNPDEVLTGDIIDTWKNSNLNKLRISIIRQKK